jgi:hypothetical protein
MQRNWGATCRCRRCRDARGDEAGEDVGMWRAAVLQNKGEGDSYGHRWCCQRCMLDLRGGGGNPASDGLPRRPCCKGKDPELQFPTAGATDARRPSCNPPLSELPAAEAATDAGQSFNPYCRCCKCLTAELPAPPPELQCTTAGAAMGEPTPSVLQLPSTGDSIGRRRSFNPPSPVMQTPSTGASIGRHRSCRRYC